MPGPVRKARSAVHVAQAVQRFAGDGRGAAADHVGEHPRPEQLLERHRRAP